MISSRRAWVGCAVLLATTAALAGGKRVTGTVLGPDGKELAGVEISANWTITKDKFEPKDKIRTDRTGRFAGEVAVGDGPVMLMAMDKERKNAALVLLKPDELAKPLKLTLAPLGAVTASSDLSRFEEAPSTVKVAVSLDPEGIEFVRGEYSPSRVSINLPHGKYTIDMSIENAMPFSEQFELTAEEPKADLGKIAFKPSRDYVKAQAGKLPKLTITDARGVSKDIKLEDFKGKWVFLEFWGFW